MFDDYVHRPIEHDITRDEWITLVTETITAHPSWMADTVNAVQYGVLNANNRLRDRIADVSLALWQALSTKPNHVKRQRNMIIRGIEATNFHPTEWSAAAIAAEQRGQNQNQDRNTERGNQDDAQPELPE